MRGVKVMDNEKLKKISQNLVSDNQNYINSFKKNLNLYFAEREFTIRELSEVAEVPFDTLKSFLYGDRKDCKLSNAVKLAKALNVSIDELVGAETIPKLSRESLAMCRNLPENDLYLVRWFIRYLDSLNKKTKPNKRYISVMLPEKDNDGNYKITSHYEKIDISNLDEPLRSKIFIGFGIHSDYHMPYYSPNDIILVANDRPSKANENVVVRAEKYLFIVKQKNENGVAKFYSIRDGKYRIDKSNNIEIVGYIAAVLKTDGSIINN